jgi:hypothetical protein
MGMRDKRLAQRKVANESNSGMPQRDILPAPAGTGREAGSSSPDPRLYDPHGRHYGCERVRQQERRRRNSALLRYSIVWIYST